MRAGHGAISDGNQTNCKETSMLGYDQGILDEISNVSRKVMGHVNRYQSLVRMLNVLKMKGQPRGRLVHIVNTLAPACLKQDLFEARRRG